MFKSEVRRFSICMEIIKFLLQKNDFVSTTGIQEALYRKGILKDNYPEGSERRKLNRALEFLEQEDYIESRYPVAKGRKPQEWRVNLKNLPYLVSLTEEELISLLTLMAFVPENYKKLEVFEPLKDLIARLGKGIDSSKREIIENSFSYENQFLEKFLRLDNKNLLPVHQAILNRNSLIVKYKGSNPFELFPIKIFVYNGILYLGAINEEKEFRTYHLAGIKIIDFGKKQVPKYLYRKYKNTAFAMEHEKPFIFGIKVSLKDSLLYFKNPTIFPTQFFIQTEKEYYLIYLVGYTGSRFTSRFLVEEIIEIIPPQNEMIEKAKSGKLKEIHPGLSFGIKENQKRFKTFIRDFESFINQRREALEKLSCVRDFA